MRVLAFEIADSVLRYEPETGKLFWKKRPPEMFNCVKYSPEQVAARWNTEFAGKEAFTASTTGYRVGAIFATNYLAHRIAWLLHYGEFPVDQIDHINGDRSDNRITNLRSVSNRENCKNQCTRSDNTTGVTGVYWFKRDSKWVVSIACDGVQTYIGRFDSFDEAVHARKSAEKARGFHANHGRAA